MLSDDSLGSGSFPNMMLAVALKRRRCRMVFSSAGIEWMARDHCRLLFWKPHEDCHEDSISLEPLWPSKMRYPCF
jgi:hypothetical protein